MDLVCINNEYYDPYYILGVSEEDTDEAISSAFKKRAKKYHPDKAARENKAKYELRFAIILESYEFIKNKRTSIKQKSVKTKFEPREREEDYEEQQISTRNYERTDDIKTYDKVTTELHSNMINQFGKKKYSNKKFNQIFEYCKEQEQQENKPELNLTLHKTSDGFYGFNNNIGGSLVSTYNGILVNDDNEHINWSTMYSDYNRCYNNSKNPQKIIKVKKTKTTNTNVSKVSIEEKMRELKLAEENLVRGSYKEEQEKLYKKMLQDLIDKEEYDKQVVMKQKKLYDKEVIRQAINGQLEASPTLISTLKQHYKYIT